MHLVVNGKRTEVAAGSTLSDLLVALGLGARWVVAERNGEPIPRPAMAETVLADGDRIEFVRAVAGG